jgi:hypothetical protein
LFIRRPRWEFASNFDSACFFSLNTCWLVSWIHFHFYPLSVIINNSNGYFVFLLQVRLLCQVAKQMKVMLMMFKLLWEKLKKRLD